MRLYPLVLLILLTGCSTPDPSVLVFSKTAGFRHAAIPAGQEMFGRLADERGFNVEFTEDSLAFNDDNLQRFDAIVFLLTTMDVLGSEGEVAMERFIQSGGGYVGIHAASDTEYGWPWYGQLVGGYFAGHPPGTQNGTMTVADSSFAAMLDVPATWVKEDEWYDQRMVNAFINVVLTVDEFSYKTDAQNPRLAAKPVAWYHEFDGGRSFYTALGHTADSYTDPTFVSHVAGGLEWAIGEPDSKDYSRGTVRPLEEEFQQTVLLETLNEPMEVDVLPDGRVLFIERRGEVHLVDPETGSDQVVMTLDPHTEFEDGVLGLAVDPGFEANNWVYIYHSPKEISANRLTRFTFSGNTIAAESAVTVLEVPTQRVECCHAGGSVEFGPDGTLYLSTGDNTNPFASSGFSPADERPGREPWDAQRTSANADDLPGKILRIQPQPEGGYTVPDGNLFPTDGSRGRPEIYAMGLRNPFRINVDQQNGWLYWGDIGPDAADDDSVRGPRGHDEINQARGPGFFGWPYFVADNQPYARFDFSRETAGDFAVGAAPINESPNNTGRSFLPPAQGAWIAYPYGFTDKYPVLGAGGRSAMAGPIYHADRYPEGSRFPSYYSGRLFMHEWMRNHIYVVAQDRHGWYSHMELFLQGTSFSRPVDLAFAPDGSLYVLEYGGQWNKENPDARLRRIQFGG